MTVGVGATSPTPQDQPDGIGVPVVGTGDCPFCSKDILLDLVDHG